MEEPNLDWLKEIANQVELLEDEAAYANIQIVIQGGFIVATKVERSAKSIAELARYARPPVGSPPDKGE